MSEEKLALEELVLARGEAKDLREARGLIMAGKVLVSDAAHKERKIDKPKTKVALSVGIRIKGRQGPYVSRSGQKLAGGLDTFGLEVCGWVCADFGLSTGGFTDCLLQRGASRVHGVDVDYGRVHWSLRQDPRLVLHERCNARNLKPLAWDEAVDLVVADVSFISIAAVLPAAYDQLRESGQLVVLVKPQFELPRALVPDGGVVTDDALRQQAADSVALAAAQLGLHEVARADSTLAGTSGNLEILMHLARVST